MRRRAGANECAGTWLRAGLQLWGCGARRRSMYCECSGDPSVLLVVLGIVGVGLRLCRVWSG